MIFKQQGFRHTKLIKSFLLLQKLPTILLLLKPPPKDNSFSEYSLRSTDEWTLQITDILLQWTKIQERKGGSQFMKPQLA